jgi:hypothetical protein
MKRYALVPVLVLAFLAALCGSALGAAPNPLVAHQISALQKTVKLQALQIASLKKEVSTLSGQVQSNTTQVGGVVGQVKTNTTDITTLGAGLACQGATLLTIDYGFIDAFDVLGGQPEQYAGQVVPDNGACAAIGVTPPTPAAITRQPALTPFQAQLRDIAAMLGVAKP